MLDTNLITKALQLTGKTIEDMEITLGGVNLAGDYCYEELSIEKFCYYLLSPEFIEKYTIHTTILADNNDAIFYIKEFGKGIFEYQNGNEQPLIELLSKI